MVLHELAAFLDSYLDVAGTASADRSLNGIQIARGDGPVERVALAVDACAQTARRAVEWGADVLLVHHGLFWGRPIAIAGTHYTRLKVFLDGDMALYASHLPLDRHAEVGNNAVMARTLGLTDLIPFGEYHGLAIGWKGLLPQPMRVDDVCAKLFGSVDSVLGVLPFGPDEVRSVGIVSGGAPDEVNQAIDEELDLYITGDASHTIYHRCLEAGISVVFGGHYQTEVWGVQALGDRLRAEFALETEFIDVPTGL